MVADSLQELRERLAATPGPSLAPLNDDDGEAVQEINDRRAAMALMRWQAEIPMRFWDASLDTLDLDTGQLNELTEWAVAERPPNLVLFGPVGPGKSHCAVAAVRAAFGRGFDVAFEPAGEMFWKLQPNDNSRSEMHRMLTVGRLVIDDLGSEKSSEATTVALGLIVNRRWLEMLPTIVTTNLDPTDKSFEAMVGEHTYSRLVGGALVMRITGKDRRRKS